MSAPIALGKYPRAILHIDGDAFFASCEQARNPELMGKPVITGKERGIVASMSYEAKALGISRASSIYKIKKQFPQVVILPSDYETYSLLSIRFYEIVRRYTPDVEEYSIDECFAELTGWQRPHRMSYVQIAQKIQEDLRNELGFTFSIGLASTKVMAKVGSKWKKPYGLTEIPNRKIHLFLENKPVGDIWGIGPQTSALLNRLGVWTALDFARREEPWVRKYFTKPQIEIWNELNGRSVIPLQLEPKTSYHTIQKMKTFTPPSSDFDFVFAQLCKNIENATMKARRYQLEAKKVYILLKTQDYNYYGAEILLSAPSNFAHEIIEIVRPIFEQKLFKKGVFYRASMCGLLELEKMKYQQDLFGGHVKVERMRELYSCIDKVRERHGKHTLHFGVSHAAHTFSQHLGERGDIPERKVKVFRGETTRRHVYLPTMGQTID